MANEDLRVRISAMVQGLDQVESLKNAVRGLQTATTPAAADLTKLKNAAMALGSASNRTESDLRKSINALKDVRAQLSLTGREYQQLTGTINKYQAQLDKATGAQQRGGKALQFAQTAGAVAASGVFGGPEGLIGAGVGAFFGPQGALAGGAIGAQVGMARQQVNQFATYAADISKLEIALKGVTKTQDEYQRALAASASVTRDFNVPQLEATKGITQLSAAVIGAGGKVADAEVVFRNVTAAIKASGGTSQDVEGALTALGQVFSKGKVSAEELQGQLGERLPGAVTMFAKATGRTLPQLQKDLEQGVVGLADLMKFVTSDQGLGQFEDRAKSVAQSSADAGARLTATWNDTKRAIGDAILPLGAQIQDSLAQALRNATPALVSFAGALSSAIKVLVDNGPLIGDVLKTLLGFGAVVGVAAGAVKLAGAFATATTAIAQLGGAMGVASVAARTLGVSIAAIPGIGWIAAGVTALGLLTAELYTSNDAFRNWADNFIDIAERDFKAAWNEIVFGASWLRDRLSEIFNFIKDNAVEVATFIGNSFGAPFGYIARIAASTFSRVLQSIKDLWNGIPAPIRAAFGKTLGSAAVGALKSDPLFATSAWAIEALQAPPRQRQGAAGGQLDRGQAPSALTEWEKLQQKIESDKSKAAGKAGDDAERLATEQQRLNEATARAQAELARTVFNNQMELIRKRWDYEEQRLKSQRELEVGALTGIRAEQAAAFREFLGQREAILRQLRESTLGVVTAERNAQFNAQMEAVTGQGLGGNASRFFPGGARTSRLRDPDGEATGWDIVMPGGRGAAVKAPIDLTITGTGFQGSGAGSSGRGYGNWITGEFSLGGKKYELLLGHFDKIDVAKGMQVPAGATLGAQGITGRTFGTHVTTHVNPKAGASVSDAWGALETLTKSWESGRSIGGTAASVVSQTRRNIAAQGKLGSANAEVQQAYANLGLTKEQVEGQLAQLGKRYAQERTKSLRAEAAQMERNNQLALERMKLEQSGMRPELIEATLSKRKLELDYLERKAQIEADIASGEGGAVGAALLKEELAGVTGQYERQIELINSLAQAQTASGVALANYVGQLKQQLADLTNVENVLIRVGQVVETEISTAMSSAVTAVVTGSGSIKQALSQMFASIGQAFVKMATDIIAKQLVIIALNSIAKIFGGGGFGFSGAGPVSGASVFGGGQAGFNPAAFSGGFAFAKGGVMSSRGPVPLKKYARGGVANSPQLAMFGEGSQPEAYVPLPDGRRIPVAMQAPANNNGRLRDLMGASPAQAPAPVLNMRFETTQINGVEYVSREQLEQAMAETRRQASKDGAQRGMSMTLDRLQQSPSTRSRVGIR